MSDASYHLDQAQRFDRVAAQCTVPELVPYYRKLAADHRRNAALLEGRQAAAWLLEGELT